MPKHSDNVGKKTIAKAKKVAREINSLTTSAIYDIWKERKLHRKKKEPKQKLTKKAIYSRRKLFLRKACFQGLEALEQCPKKNAFYWTYRRIIALTK